MTRHVYDMTGQLCYTFNSDSGRRWMLVNALDKPVHTWDNLQRKTTFQYDALNRPVATLLYNNNTTALKVESITYGNSATGYTIGKPIIIRDQSGKLDITSYDFKGNMLSTSRRLCTDYSGIINWNTYTDPTGESFCSSFTFDAMNRPVTETTPDDKVRTYEYNKAGLLEKVKLGNDYYVSDINYNEKGQRTDIIYGNSTKTRYYYDAQTFRLTRLLTTRNNGSVILQDLNYTYDPEGNIVQQEDNAQQTNYFSNTFIAPVGKYEYDALYRIVKAEGRELTGLGMATDTDFVNNIPCPNPANVTQNYTQLYTYDQLGNMLSLQSQNRWTRAYYYDTATNRLLRHDTGSNVYTYDAHGNMLTMPHLQLMAWDYKGNLVETRRTGGTYSTYYCYDAESNRVRKVTVNGTTREERIYIGNYEVYRKTIGGVLNTERQSSFVSDDTKRIAIVDTCTTPTPVQVTIRYQHDNHLGSACLEQDGNGAIISYEEYHPFGTTSYRAGRSQTEAELKRYKYVGKERDEETGLYYYGARYYAAWICRFVSVDPLQLKYPELTPFQYASNRPITGIDLDGLEFYSKEETVIRLGINSINWNTDNISESLRRSISKPQYYKKEKYDSLLSAGASYDIEIVDFNVDKYLQAYHYDQSGMSYLNKNSESLSPKSYDSTPLTKNWVVDKRYNPKTSNTWWINSARGSKASTMFTLIIQSIKIAEVLNNNNHITTDVEKAISQVNRLLQSVDLFEQAINSGYIAKEITESHDFSYFRKDVINYIFSGELPENGCLNYRENDEWKEVLDYRAMIKEIGTNIYNDKANKYNKYSINE